MIQEDEPLPSLYHQHISLSPLNHINISRLSALLLHSRCLLYLCFRLAEKTGKQNEARKQGKNSQEEEEEERGKGRRNPNLIVFCLQHLLLQLLHRRPPLLRCRNHKELRLFETRAHYLQLQKKTMRLN